MGTWKWCSVASGRSRPPASSFGAYVKLPDSELGKDRKMNREPKLVEGE